MRRDTWQQQLLGRGPGERSFHGLSFSDACSTTQLIADRAGELGAPVTITHPFHPLFGQTIECVDRKSSWGDDRVFYRSHHGHLASLPTGWTRIGPRDPFIVLSNGRSRFRVDDLMKLISLMEEIR